MSYTRPSGTAANFAFGPAYTRPPGDAADFSFGTGPAAVEGTGAATLTFSAVGAAEHAAADLDPVVGTGAASLGFAASGLAAHGVAGTGSAALGLSATGVAQHPRYVLRGEVRDAGVLVNRTVRAYRRDTGALLAQQATVAGRFDLAVGFEPLECYVLPIDLSGTAADWLPPVANRVLSVLAVDGD